MTRPPLFGAHRRVPPKPLSPARGKALDQRLFRINSDPLKRDFNDPEFRDFVVRAFETAYPPEAETPEPVDDALPEFRPTPRPRDVLPEGSVGPREANRPADVIGAKRVLSALGTYRFDPGDEPSTTAGPGLVDAVERFQTAHSLEPDGVLQPGGPTLQAMAAEAFPGEGLEDRVARAAAFNPHFEAKRRKETEAKLAAFSGTATDGSTGRLGDHQTAEASPDRAPRPEGTGDPIPGEAGREPGAKHDWNRIIADLLKREGGFNKNDPSKFGILDDTLRDHRARQGQALTDAELRAEVEALTKEEAIEIYRGIVDRHRLDEVPDEGLAEQLFDGIVNHGPGHANPWLQEELNALLQRNEANAIAVDNIIGSETLGALREAADRGLVEELRNRLVKRRTDFIEDLPEKEDEDDDEGFPPEILKALMERAESFRP